MIIFKIINLIFRWQWIWILTLPTIEVFKKTVNFLLFQYIKENILVLNSSIKLNLLKFQQIFINTEIGLYFTYFLQNISAFKDHSCQRIKIHFYKNIYRDKITNTSKGWGKNRWNNGEVKMKEWEWNAKGGKRVKGI